MLIEEHPNIPTRTHEKRQDSGSKEDFLKTNASDCNSIRHMLFRTLSNCIAKYHVNDNL